MSSGIGEWFYNIILFVMFSSLLLQMSAAKKYDKYIKFFAGLILVILVISPVVRWVGSDKVLEMNYMNECFLQAADDAAEEMKDLQELQNENISDNYKKQIQISMESIIGSYGYSLVNADIVLNSDENDIRYLYPEQIHAKIQSGLHNENVIEKVIVGKTESQTTQQEDFCSEISKQIADFFSLEEEAVIVEVV